MKDDYEDYVTLPESERRKNEMEKMYSIVCVWGSVRCWQFIGTVRSGTGSPRVPLMPPVISHSLANTFDAVLASYLPLMLCGRASAEIKAVMVVVLPGYRSVQLPVTRPSVPLNSPRFPGG
ncbi:hypothetical protein E2C01_000529 [Portunus trituberculatus]|uniref:Uncharacterized protein n=1 Tax=Portunus trituberculatus TaxID=210409 RepID=A0A5B7CFD6_PORTR|nr:hypothetical protein [Portunus trituberculatus]